MEGNVKITPAEATFSRCPGRPANMEYSVHKLRNFSSHKLAVKVKCSDNHTYRVSAVHLSLEPWKEAEIVAGRFLDAAPKPDKLVILLAKAASGRRGPEAVWAEKGRVADGTLTVWLSKAGPPESRVASPVAALPFQEAKKAGPGRFRRFFGGLFQSVKRKVGKKKAKETVAKPATTLASAPAHAHVPTPDPKSDHIISPWDQSARTSAAPTDRSSVIGLSTLLADDDAKQPAAKS